MRSLIASFGYAFAGFGTLLLRERNGRIHLAAAVAVVIAGFGVGLSRSDWLWIAAAIGIVLMAEAFNTAIEALCDTLHPERAEGIRKTKDVAAAGVLIAALAALAIGILVFWPYVVG